MLANDYIRMYLITFRALSSIMVLCWPCPYSIFTKREWKQVTSLNPYILNKSPLPPELSTSIYEAAHNHLIRKDIIINGGIEPINCLCVKFNIIICSQLTIIIYLCNYRFINQVYFYFITQTIAYVMLIFRYNYVPEVAPSKLSEEEHVCMFLYPISRPSFTGPEKEYACI